MTTRLARYERGDTLSRENLELARAPSTIRRRLSTCCSPIASASTRSGKSRPRPLALTAEERRRIVRAVLAAGWTTAEVTCDELIRNRKPLEKRPPPRPVVWVAALLGAVGCGYWSGILTGSAVVWPALLVGALLAVWDGARGRPPTRGAASRLPAAESSMGPLDRITIFCVS